jgi:hypothetical protein
MKKTIYTLTASLLLAGASNAATTVSFSDLDNSNGIANNDLNVDGSSDGLSVTRAISSGVYTFTISYTDMDFDGDSVNDTLSYEVIVSGMSGNTVSTSLSSTGASGTSGEVTLDGIDASVGEAISGTWDAFGVGNNMQSGETLIFTVENITVDVSGDGDYTGIFDGFSSFTSQSAGGDEALTIVGEGTGLTEAYTTTFTTFSDLSETTLYVSSANPTAATDDWGVRFLDYSITVIPEPGTYALLAGLLSLSFVMLRRRQA